jgi:hypothetical protein
VRFELTSPVKGLRFSRPVQSTALPPLRGRSHYRRRPPRWIGAKKSRRRARPTDRSWHAAIARGRIELVRSRGARSIPLPAPFGLNRRDSSMSTMVRICSAVPKFKASSFACTEYVHCLRTHYVQRRLMMLTRRRTSTLRDTSHIELWVRDSRPRTN